MPRFKNETLSIRTTAEIKDLLRQAAGCEQRSVAAMIEALVVDYAKRHGLAAAITEPSRRKAQKK